MHIGDSISVNGACLTVIDFTDSSFQFKSSKGLKTKHILEMFNVIQKLISKEP